MTTKLEADKDFVQVRTGTTPYLMTGLPLDTISDYILQKRFPYEHDFLKRIVTLVDRDKFFVDAGAHIGNLTVYLAVIGGMKGIAFEPNPEAFHVLNRNLEINDLKDDVSAQNLGLSEAKILKTFTMSELRDPGGYSALRKPDQNSFNCRTVPLDDYLGFFKGRPVGFINIDAEGSEPEALSGCVKVLEHYKPFVSTRIFNTRTFDLIYALLGHDLGYVPIDIHNQRTTIIWAHPSSSSAQSDLRSILRYANRSR